MKEWVKSVILKATGASALRGTAMIQELWSGYGNILRVELDQARVGSVVIKHVQLPLNSHHPRGWNTDLGHQRKVKSYQVEMTWYDRCSQYSQARLPQCLAIETQGDEVLIVLEDLDEAGYSLRKGRVNWAEISSCLAWLAQFHASYLGKSPEGLWEVGTYWHLETRPQELAALRDQSLKEAASAIDEKLNGCNYQTYVHGDAKLANFCFGKEGQVAGVDFQYVGGGCG